MAAHAMTFLGTLFVTHLICAWLKIEQYVQRLQPVTRQSFSTSPLRPAGLNGVLWPLRSPVHMLAPC